MAGGGTPRQKMINLMYLVLLALLAMNVSKEILNSFALINNGLVATNKNFAVKNNITYNQFEMQLANDPNKVRPYYDKAIAVRKRSQEMFDYIEKLKEEVIHKVEQKDEVTFESPSGKDTTIKIVSDVMHMEGKDDAPTPTNYFFGNADKAEQGNKAFEFKEKIIKFKEDLLTYVPKKDQQDIKLGLDLKDIFSEHAGRMITWEENNFYNNPAIAVVALLTKMQNDVKNGEADIINVLYNKIDQNTFKFDRLEARVNAESNYVLIGDDYKAEVFVAGFSTTSNPQIWLGEYDSTTNSIKGTIDSTSVKVINGVGHLTETPTIEGTKKWGGIIRVKNPADPMAPPKVFPFLSSYQSARPAIVVSPDKMNVFYIGVDNPVSISVPGIAAEDLQPSVAGGNISGSKGKYTVRVSRVGKCIVNVSAKMKTGGTKSMGKGLEFRVKNVPDPVAEFMGKRGSDVIQQAALKGAAGVVAKLDNFEFDLKFPVVSFKVSMNVNGQDVEEVTQGPTLNSKQKELLYRARKGNKVYIEQVKVKKPDGTIRDIGSVILKVI